MLVVYKNTKKILIVIPKNREQILARIIYELSLFLIENLIYSETEIVVKTHNKTTY
jgi:hypothetical protein